MSYAEIDLATVPAARPKDQAQADWPRLDHVRHSARVLLDQVAKVFIDHPEMKRVRVEPFLLTHEIVAKTMLGISPDETPRWG